MVLICISLMTSDVEHFFIHLLVICLWRNIYSSPLSIFKIGLTDFLLLLNCRSSLYIQDINTLLDIRFENIFLHPIGCLFTLLIMSFDYKSL